MIQGIHHVCLKADTQENYTKAITFYTEVLGCSIKRQWKTPMGFRHYVGYRTWAD